MCYTAAVVSIEVDKRQQYIFETDKLQEMLGASRIITGTVDKANALFKETETIYLFSPVSGEIRGWAPIEKKCELLAATWNLREWLDGNGVAHSIAYLETHKEHFTKPGKETFEGVLDKQGRPVDPGAAKPNLGWVHWALGEIIRKQKDAKCIEDAHPRCSLFAACGVHGLEAANEWLPDPKSTEPLLEERRRLLGWRAAAKRLIWRDEKAEIYGRLVSAAWESAGENGTPTKEQIAEEASKLSQNLKLFEDGSDSYIGYACGDGDGMGDLLSNLHWNDCSQECWSNDPRDPWRRNRDFSLEFDGLVKRAFEVAIKNLEKQSDKRPLGERLLPQLLGGDDLWMVGEKGTILEVCKRFIKSYEEMAIDVSKNEFATLRQALKVAKIRQKLENKPEKPLLFTISMGIAFAKSGHPVFETIDVAESLMQSAKKLRKGIVPKEREAPNPPKGCLDWHWIESSLSEDISDVRKRGWMYTGSKGETMLLTTRPWTHDEVHAFGEAAVEFHQIPRRKREQLEEILRLGKTLGDLAWKSWSDGLEIKERKTVENIVSYLGVWKPDVKRSPWVDLCIMEKNGERVSVYGTPFIDLLALQHVLGLEQSASSAETLPNDKEPEHEEN
jgi:hypothetical protein